MKFLLLLIFFLAGRVLHAQVNYTQSIYAYDSLKNVVYGTATNYAGNIDTLKLDIYKPAGDTNCLRPLMVLVHGGDWIGGSKDDVDLVYMSRELARKGWVVANINYRLGTHKASSYQMYALCNNTISQPCAYICDSSEIFRANYRGMQDAKGAIRFMKSRNAADSTDINNVFIAGESAGGFISMAAAFTDSANEKPDGCYAIADAPNPDLNLIPYGCIQMPALLMRPDLGDIEGSLHIGIFDSRVKGVGNFFGGVFDLNMLHQNLDTPSVYLFHQGSDVVVNYTYGPLLGRVSWECFAQTNLCQSYYFYPNAFGSEGIRQYFVSLGNSSPDYLADIVANYSYLNNCFSNGHSIDNIQLRLQNMVDFFAVKIGASGNEPIINCLNSSIDNNDGNSGIIIFPNPAAEQITIVSKEELNNTRYKIYDLPGKQLLEGNISGKTTTIKTEKLSSGIYFLKFFDLNRTTYKIVKN